MSALNEPTAMKVRHAAIVDAMLSLKARSVPMLASCHALAAISPIALMMPLSMLAYVITYGVQWSVAIPKPRDLCVHWLTMIADI